MRYLLQEKDESGKVHVIKSKKVLDNLTKHFSRCQTAAPGPVPTKPTTVPQLNPEKLAKFIRRRREGYDLPDPEYEAWLKSLEGH